MTAIANRYEFVFLFDVTDGNPNGDPDAGNLPRVDPETGNGLITDVCLKRKVRNYISIAKEDGAPYEIYVREKAILNVQNERAYQALNLNPASTEEVASPEAEGKKPAKKEKRKGGKDDVSEARSWMCQNFYDVRTFGAVMSTGTNCGQVRGPVQLTFARSINPVIAIEHSITRMAVTTEKEAENQQGDNRTMGRKATIPYGLYRAHGFISAHLAADTKFTEEDLDLFFESLQNMFDHDHSAARGQMNARSLYIFKHDSKLGNAPAHKLFDLINVRTESETPRNFSDYSVQFDKEALPKGVVLDSRSF